MRKFLLISVLCLALNNSPPRSFNDDLIETRYARPISPNPIYDIIQINIVYNWHGLPQFREVNKFCELLKDYNFTQRINLNIFPVIDPFSISQQTRIWDGMSLDRFLKEVPVVVNSEPNALTLNIIYVTGDHAPPLTNLAGVTYSKNSFAMFRNGVPHDREATVLLHEFGHILNFIRENLRPPPIRPDRPRHCNNPDCVMFWTVDDHCKLFDRNCILDIRAKYCR